MEAVATWRVGLRLHQSVRVSDWPMRSLDADGVSDVTVWGARTVDVCEKKMIWRHIWQEATSVQQAAAATQSLFADDGRLMQHQYPGVSAWHILPTV